MAALRYPTIPQQKWPPNEASANKDNEEKKSAAVDSSTSASKDNQTAKKTDPREKFLSKLEQQSNSNTSADGTTTTDMKSDMKDTSDDTISDIVVDTEDMKQSSKEKDIKLKAVNEKKDEAAPLCSLKSCCNTQKVELPIVDQLLINYLSNYCVEPVNGGGSNAAAAVSSPSDWLHDIEPSSLSFLKGLAGIKEPSSLPSQPNNDIVAFNVQVATTVPLPTVATAVTDQKLDTSIPSYGVTNYSKETIKKAPKDEFGTKTYKIYEVIVPSHVTPGQPFVLKASGVTVRVKCPMNVKTGQKIRFHLPTKLFDVPLPPPPPPLPQMPSQQIMEEEFSDMMALEEAMFGGANKATLPPVKMTGIGAPKDDETKPKSKPSTNNNNTAKNNNNNSGDETSVENRMLDIIERQQTQLADMQARIDVLGGMMAQMQNDVGYLCHNTWQQQNNNSGQQGRQQQQQQNRMGGLFGRGEAAPGIVQQLPQAVPAVAHRGQRAPPLHQQQLPVPPQAAVPVAAADAAPHQGFFFPLFAALFRFIIDLPQRVRTLLLSTGVGRVYTHLRQEAIARNAFRNIDFGSLMKLVVMLLIFTGRVGGDSGGGRNNRRNQNQEAEGGIFYILLQSLIDYWNGHRVHTLVIASMIAFLIQVGLMSFFYQVLWVERGELLRVWLGQDPPADVEETEDNDDDGDGSEQGADADGNAEAREGGANNNNNNNANRPAQRPRPRQRARDWRRHPNHVPPARRNVAQPAAAAEEGIYLFRRGENGGFFHDIQSLFLSFLLSLIPAWRVEEAAEPLPTPEPEPQPAETDQDAASQQPETDGQAGQEEENAGDDDNNEDDGNAAE